MFLFKIIIFVNSLFFSYFKNIILPFKKITIEDFNGRKTIDDLINFNIYTNISMGTPPQIVAHFIEQNTYTFHFKKRMLSYNYAKYSQFLGDIYNLTNFWFNNKKSTTFAFNDKENYCSDVFYFKTLNNTEIKVDNLKHNIHTSDMLEKYKCGIIGLNNPSEDVTSDKHIRFLEALKEKEVIGEYSITILYEEKNNLFNYNKELNLGTIVIGESPYVFNPKKYKKEDEVANRGINWSIFINEVYIKNKNYSEINVEMQFSLITCFIKGTVNYKKKIEKLFFSELIKDKKCEVELLGENVFPNEYYVYSCNNNKEIQDKIKLFPDLIFEIKTNNLTFIFTYNDLFKEFNDKIYFMVIFLNEKYSAYVPRWTMGEIFLRKYLTSFNQDTKLISFYRNQVDEMNNKNQNNYEPSTPKKSLSLSNHIRTLFEIIMGIIIIFILYLLYRKYRNSRKLHANELEDSNYVYVQKENKNPILLNKQRELNKIIY